MVRREPARKALLGAATLALALGPGSPARGQGDRARPTEKVVLQISYCPQFQFAGYYAALERGYYAAEGLDVEIRPAKGPTPTPLQETLAGAADFGTCESDIVLARTQGKPVVLLAAIFQHSALCIVARRDSGIVTPADLVGRRLALTRGHRDAEVMAMLKREGIAAEKLTITETQWDIEDLVSGKIDARLSYMTNEPDQRRRRGIEPTVIQPVTYGIDFYGDCLFTTEAQVRDHPERVAAFRRASLRGWEEAFEHEDAIVEALYSKYGARELGLSREHLHSEAEAIRRLVDPKLIEIGHVNRGRWRRIAETYAELGLLRTDAAIEGLLYDPNAGQAHPWLRWLALGLAVSLGVGGGSLLWARHLRRLVERRTAELRESEERFRSAFESAFVGCALTSIDGRLTRVNRALSAILGYEPEELVGKLFNDVTHPDDRAISSGKTRKFLKGEIESTSFEKRYLHKSGRTIWALVGIALVRDSAGAPLYTIAQVHDLTQRRTAEDALRESETRFRTMADGAPVMIWLARADGSYEFLSQRWLAFTGRRLEEEIGQGWTELLHPLDRDRCLEEHRAAFEKREAFECVYRLRRADGEWRSMLERGSPRFLADGQFAGFVGSCVDVSDRQLLEEQLRQSQKMEAIGRLAGGVAHDFNNILAVVQGYTDLLNTAMGGEDPRRGHVEHISSAVEHASTLTRQLLALNRNQFLSPTVLDLNAVVVEMQLLLKRIIGEDVELATTLGARTGRVKADRAQLEQVILNLVVNARDAMPRGGKLALETSFLEVTAATPRPKLEPGCWVVLVVRDTGTGMDERTLARIFEPFFTTKERGKGTGLGLSTVYGIVTQSGGRVDVTSEPGRGSAFQVFLPEATEPLATAALPAPAEPPRGTETILLVEDDPRVRSTTKAMLQVQGYKVLTAEDGVQALEVLAGLDEPVHLVLTDVVMPRMSGPELAQRLAAQLNTPRVLFMSGYLDDRSVPAGGLPPGSLLLEKPFGLVVLALKVREALRSVPTPVAAAPSRQ